MGKASNIKIERRMLTLLDKLDRANAEASRRTGSAAEKLASGLGIPLVGWVLRYFGAPPEAVPIAALIGTTLIVWAVMGLEPVRKWLASVSLAVRLGVTAIAAVFVLAFTGASWVMAGRSVNSTQIGGYPKFSSRQEVSGIGKGVPCSTCEDELDLDGDGTLYISDIGRGFVQMALSETPTVVLDDPAPGEVPLPNAGGAGKRWRIPVGRQAPQNGPPSSQEARIGLSGTAAAGSVTIDTVTIPEGFPKGNTLTIRGDKKSEHRFDVGGQMEHTLGVAGRTFVVKLSRIKEEPSPDRRRMIFRYTFRISEP